MNENQVEGTANKVAGRIQDAAGALTGDADQQVKGKARAAAGDVQAKTGDVVERVREWAADRPLSAVVITAGLSFLLGRLTANRD
ncbi:MAG: CsbD family protein [Rhodanobacter sp.]